MLVRFTKHTRDNETNKHELIHLGDKYIENHLLPVKEDCFYLFDIHYVCVQRHIHFDNSVFDVEIICMTPFEYHFRKELASKGDV